MKKVLIRVGVIGDRIEGLSNIRVDRVTGLGNPFFKHDESMRDSVCEQYDEWFQTEVDKDGSSLRQNFLQIVNIVNSGESVNLTCHCRPKRCHANTIARSLKENCKNVQVELDLS
ncbi:hypothetical protein [Vibrio phage Artemius]|nr:hypothetical protein [Vibrio phage Artemius]